MTWERQKGESKEGSVFPFTAKDKTTGEFVVVKGRWVAEFKAFDWKDDLRSYKKTTFTSESKAHRGMEALERRALANKKEPEPEEPQIRETLGEYLDRWHKKRVRLEKIRLSTAGNERRHIQMIREMMISSKLLGALTPDDVEGFLEELEEGHLQKHPRAQQMVYATFRTAVNAAPRRILKANPCVGMKAPDSPDPVTKAFSASELRRILKAVEQPRPGDSIVDTRFACLIWTLARTGARIGEIQALRWQDVNFGESEITICQAASEVKVEGKKGGIDIGPTKNGRSRAIHMPGVLAQRLQAHKASLGVVPHGSMLVFGDDNGKPLRRSNVLRRKFHPLLARLKIERCGFHRLRHTFATLNISMGVDIVTVSKALGHKKTSITVDRYSHLVPGKQREASDRFDALLELRDSG